MDMEKTRPIWIIVIFLISVFEFSDLGLFWLLFQCSYIHRNNRPCFVLVFFSSVTEHSSGSSGRVRGGARNMKSMRLPSAAIFFMTYFYRARGGMAPWAPLDPLLKHR